MIKRKATSVWKGSGKDGSGTVSTESTVLENAQYSYKTRFEDGVGTNPEELIGAAHSGCFAMKLSFDLNAAGYTAEELNVTATVSLDPGKGEVVKSHLVLKGKVPGIDAEEFAKIAEESKKGCPISKLLKAELTLDAELIS